MQEIVWILSYCAGKGTTEDTQELKLFKRYMDDIALSRETLYITLSMQNSLNNDLQFTLETLNV